MYITAHRVRNVEGRTAIHAFRHRHDPERCPFPDDPVTVPLEAPGVLEAHEAELPMGGNDVLSYLDLIARDPGLIAAVQDRLQDLGPLLQERALPVVVQLGDVTVIFGAAPKISSPAEEYQLLLHRALRMLPA